MSVYSFHVDSTDLSVAYDAEADRARSEGFYNVENRQRANALHVRNAVHQMSQLCPDGYRTIVEITVSHVPAINSTLKDEYRK